MKKRVLCVLPARKGSKRLKNKNVLPLCGFKMYEYTLEEAKKSKLIDDIVISTDIEELLKLKNIYTIKRPKEMCNGKSPLDDALRHAIKTFNATTYDYLVMPHVNIPIRKEGEIDKLIKIALKNPEATAVCTGVEVTEPIEWQFQKSDNKFFGRVMSRSNKVFRKQDIPERYNITGSIQVHRVDALMAGDGSAYSYFGDKIIIVPTERKYSLEVDTIDDFRYVEYLMKSEKCT